MGTAATNTTITLSDSLFTTASDLRVASLSLAAYECVASCVSLPLIVTHTRPAISSPSLWNIGCTGPLVDACKKVDASLLRYVFNWNTFDSDSKLFILFILIRHVSRHYRL
jgi:hypothetical protein